MELLLTFVALGVFISRLRMIRFEPWVITIEFWCGRNEKTGR